MLNVATNTMNTRSLSDDEIDSVSGGLGWLAFFGALAGGAGVGIGAALLTVDPDAESATITGGGSPEEPGTKVQGTARDGISKPRRPA